MLNNNNYSEMDEEIMAKIRKETENIEIPKSLEPEEMMKKLEKCKKSKVVSFRKKATIISGTLAACLALVYGIRVYNNVPDKLAKSSKISKTNVNKLENIKTFNSYEELDEYLKISVDEDRVLVYDEEMNFETEINTGYGNLVDDMQGATSEPVINKNDKDYTDTNEQVEGVSESDIVKTDGNYIYVCSEIKRAIYILKADGTKSEIVKTIKMDDDSRYNYNMYLAGDKLVVTSVCGAFNYFADEVYRIDSDSNIIEKRKPKKIRTIVEVYDVSNPAKAKLDGTTAVDGYIVDTRLVDDILYVITEVGVRFYGVAGYERNIPCINDEEIDINDIYATVDTSAKYFNGYLNVISIDVKNKAKVIDKLSMISYSSMIYVSENNIYILNCNYEEEKREKTENSPFYEEYNYKAFTDITKIGYENGELTMLASTKIEGEARDQFCIDEYNSTLRVIATKNTYDDGENITSNTVYVLGEDLKVIGKIDGIAEGESVYSARFDKDMGYFVTYRETDPVFSVDFSNPKEPKILGELELPGFSEYLHMWDDTHMLGIGKEEDEDGNFWLKLSMFDVSDSGDMKEVDKLVTPYSYSEASYNHKSIMVDLDNNTFGFVAEGYDEEDFDYVRRYIVCKYTKDSGFEYKEFDIESEYDYGEVRGVTIEDDIYIINVALSVNVIDRKTLEDKNNVIYFEEKK